jgi:hypothetical protein
MRLLSPCSKTNDSFNDKNTAIGKGKSLARTLAWLNPKYFSKKFVRLIRDRFFQRMGPLMPDTSSGVYWHLLLPEFLGGLGFNQPTDLEDLAAKLPAPTRALIKDLANGVIVENQLELFQGFTRNKSYRGYEMSESDVALAKQCLAEVLFSVPSKTFKECLKDLNIEESSVQIQLKELAKSSWRTREYLEDKVTRPFLFKEILSGQAKSCAFNTVSFKDRYAKLWDLTYSGECSITPEELNLAFKARPQFNVYNTSEKLAAPFRGKMVEVNIIDEVSLGLPEFAIAAKFVSMLVHPKRVNEPIEESVVKQRRL